MFSRHVTTSRFTRIPQNTPTSNLGLLAHWAQGSKVNFVLETWDDLHVQKEPSGQTRITLEHLSKKMGSKVNFVLETWSHLQVHQDLSRHTHVRFDEFDMVLDKVLRHYWPTQILKRNIHLLKIMFSHLVWSNN